jgi:hypothetical protein
VIEAGKPGFFQTLKMKWSRWRTGSAAPSPLPTIAKTSKGDSALMLYEAARRESQAHANNQLPTFGIDGTLARLAAGGTGHVAPATTLDVPTLGETVRLDRLAKGDKTLEWYETQVRRPSEIKARVSSTVKSARDR